MNQAPPRYEADQKTLRSILEEIAKAANIGLPAEQFFNQFCHVVANIEGVEYFAVMVRRGETFPKIVETDVPEGMRGDDPVFQTLLHRMQREVWESKTRLSLAPDAKRTLSDGDEFENCTPYTLIFEPVMFGDSSAGYVEGLFLAATSPMRLNGKLPLVEKFLTLSAAKVAQTLRLHRVRTVEEGLTQWQTVASMMAEISGQMDVPKLALSIATRTRELAKCERCSVVGKPPVGGMRVLAVSNVEAPNPRSAQVKSILMLAEDTLGNGGYLKVYRKANDRAEARGELGDYFYHTRYQEVLTVPMRTREGREVGALVLESEKADSMNATTQHLASVVAAQAGPAVGTAMEYAAIPGMGLIKRFNDWRLDPSEGKKRRALVKFGIPLGALAAILLFPWPNSYSFRCSLQPANAKPVVVEVPGTVAAVKVDGGAAVKAGQTLAELDDTDTLQQWRVAESEAVKLRSQADAEMARSTPVLAEIAALKVAQAEERAGFLKSQHEKSIIRSPIDGVVLTYDLKQRIGRFLQAGDVFCEVGDLGSWELRMEVPEADITRLQRLVEKTSPLEVTFSLNPMPGKKFTARIAGPQAMAQSAYFNDVKQNVFRVDAMVDTESGDTSNFKTGYLGKAKVRDGWRPLVVILLGRFVDYLRLTFVL